MTNLDAWLAAMPAAEIDERIDQLEAELAFFHALKQAPRPPANAGQINGAPLESNFHSTDKPPGSWKERKTPTRGLAKLQAGLTKERAAIARAVANAGGEATPHEVGNALRADGWKIQDKAIQTTIGRMESAGQLVKVARGRYRLPPEIQAQILLNGSAPEGQAVMS